MVGCVLTNEIGAAGTTDMSNTQCLTQGRDTECFNKESHLLKPCFIAGHCDGVGGPNSTLA